MNILKEPECGFSLIELSIVIVILVIISIAGWFVYKTEHKDQTKTSASTVITEFNSAMQKGNAKEVLSLESKAFQAEIKTASSKLNKVSKNIQVTNNYYSYCKSLGNICTYEFNAKNLSSAKVETKPYKAVDGSNGSQEVFTTTTSINSTSSSKTSDSSFTGSESGSSQTSFSIDVIPSGNSWLVDNVGSINLNLAL